MTPSAVWIKDDEVIVGKIARQRLVSDPAHTASLFKRAMGTNKLYELDNKIYPITAFKLCSKTIDP